MPCAKAFPQHPLRSGTAHRCLYDELHCCEGGCEANGGYWIDGTGNEKCESDPDCDDDDPATICGCDWLSNCGEATSKCSQDVEAVNAACCEGGADCSTGVPTSCSEECAPVFLGFWHACRKMFGGPQTVNALDAEALIDLAHRCKAVQKHA